MATIGPKRIMLPVHDDHGLESRLTAATALARSFNGALVCVYAHTAPSAGQAISASGMARLAEDEQREARQIRQIIEARMADYDVEWEWHEHRGNVVDALVEEAPLADIVVISPMRESSGGAMVEPIAETLLLRCPTPILIVPTDIETFDCSGTAMIAWNGSAQSALAMRAALPVLRAAADVHVVTIDKDIRRFPAARAVEYLADHGVAKIDHIDAEKAEDVSATLAGQARDLAADYIVMGGYSRSRLNELIFGGVTRHMLRRPPVPLFIVH